MTKLTDAIDAARRTEDQFLAGAAANIEQAKGRHLVGSHWKMAREDEGDALRALMASKRMYDRALLKRLPQNRRVSVTGFNRRLFFWKKPTGCAIATSLAPHGDMLDGVEKPGPIDAQTLTEHLQSIAPDPAIPHIIGVCATSGFTEEARRTRLEYPNMTVVLVEPAPEGGWRITTDDDVPQFVRDLFDPEGDEEKIKRVQSAVQNRSTDLLTGGVSAVDLAEDLNLPQPTVTAALEQIARRDPELRLSGRKGDRFLYRGAPSVTKERTSMGFVERIRELFSSEGDEVAKINLLSEKRAELAQRRNRIYEDIAKLETQEADLLNQGRENKSAVVRRRLAAQLAQLRKDISRSNTTANMLNQQINIISTNIHNLTLIQQGQIASLPSTEELTENAVQAEEMLETLQADSDLVSSLEAGVGAVITSDEERDILSEFDAPAEAPSHAPKEGESGRAAAQAEPSATEFDEPQRLASRDAEPGSSAGQTNKESGRKASDPEAT